MVSKEIMHTQKSRETAGGRTSETSARSEVFLDL